MCRLPRLKAAYSQGDGHQDDTKPTLQAQEPRTVTFNLMLHTLQKPRQCMLATCAEVTEMLFVSHKKALLNDKLKMKYNSSPGCGTLRVAIAALAASINAKLCGLHVRHTRLHSMRVLSVHPILRVTRTSTFWPSNNLSRRPQRRCAKTFIKANAQSSEGHQQRTEPGRWTLVAVPSRPLMLASMSPVRPGTRT